MRITYRQIVANLDLAGLSPKHQALLARGVRGGDGEETVDDLLGQIDGAAELDDEGLQSLLAALDGHVDELVETKTDESLETLRSVAAAIDLLRTVQHEREAAAVERDAQAQELLARIRGQQDDGEADVAEAAGPEDEDNEDEQSDGEEQPEVPPVHIETEEVEIEVNEAESEPERVAASSPPPAPTPGRVTRIRSRAPDMRPRVRAAQAPQYQLRASANVPGITAGEALTTADLRAAAFSGVIEAGMQYRGPAEKTYVATIGALDPSEMWGQDRFLDHNERENERKIRALTGPETLRASGGACIAPPVDYTRPVMGTDERPVRDALARFAADRGGVQLTPPAVFADVAGAVDDWTYANDVTPSDPTTKPCLVMTCPAPVITRVDAVTQCLKVGNFRQLYWSEQVDEWLTKTTQWAARHAEIRMLTAIGNGSTNVTVGNADATSLGTTRTVLAGLDRAAAAMRNRQRISPDFPLRFIGPAWLLDNMRVDLAREAPGAAQERLATADATLVGFFQSRNINPTWSLEGETGQMFGAQADGALNGWPAHAIGYLFVEGQWLYLDGGRVNLGTIRDSTLVGTNDFILFSEFMENVAFHGEESLRIDFDICASGRTSLPVSFDPCVLNS